MKKILLWVVVFLVIAAPFLVSPYLRASLGEALIYFGEYFSLEKIISFFWVFMVSMSMISILGFIAWLYDKSDDVGLGGWQEVVFIVASLVIFLAVVVFWVTGLWELATFNWDSASAVEQNAESLLMVPILLGSFLLFILAKPAWRSLKMLFLER